MMMQPSFEVTLLNNIVVVNISGDWNIQTDIAYLTTLDEIISKVRNEKWALFADLRDWRVSEEVINYKHNVTISLARGNQQAECWLVDNLDQGQHIQHHIENANVPLFKCLEKSDSVNWLANYGFYL